MRDIRRAQAICNVVNSRLRRGLDPAESLQAAIDMHLPEATDDYKARVYTEVIDCWHDVTLELFCVARGMELAE